MNVYDIIASLFFLTDMAYRRRPLKSTSRSTRVLLWLNNDLPPHIPRHDFGRRRLACFEWLSRILGHGLRSLLPDGANARMASRPILLSCDPFPSHRRLCRVHLGHRRSPKLTCSVSSFSFCESSTPSPPDSPKAPVVVGPEAIADGGRPALSRPPQQSPDMAAGRPQRRQSVAAGHR